MHNKCRFVASSTCNCVKRSYLIVMASSSGIGIYLVTAGGRNARVTLPLPLTLRDFKKAVNQSSLGSDSETFRFVIGGRMLDLTDEAHFDREKKLITDGSTIQCVERMCGGCFLSDTFVTLSDNTKKIIHEIQVGDSLLAFTDSGEIVTTSVQEVFIHDVDEYIELCAGQTLLRVTREHPFFIGSGHFCPLEKLRINDCLYNLADGSLQSISITSMKTVAAPMTRVYNLRTDEPHTYFANGVAVHNKFGVDFVDMSNTSGLKRIEWSTSAPKWLLVNPGMCLEGDCTNSSCAAYRQRVIINIGYGKFDLVLDANANTSKCPICSHYVEPVTCGFNNCKWRWLGIKQPKSGMPPEEISAHWRVADDAYHRFDQQISGTVVWRKLVIETIQN